MYQPQSFEATTVPSTARTTPLAHRHGGGVNFPLTDVRVDPQQTGPSNDGAHQTAGHAAAVADDQPAMSSKVSPPRLAVPWAIGTGRASSRSRRSTAPRVGPLEVRLVSPGFVGSGDPQDIVEVVEPDAFAGGHQGEHFDTFPTVVVGSASILDHIAARRQRCRPP